VLGERSQGQETCRGAKRCVASLSGSDRQAGSAGGEAPRDVSEDHLDPKFLANRVKSPWTAPHAFGYPRMLSERQSHWFRLPLSPRTLVFSACSAQETGSWRNPSRCSRLHSSAVHELYDVVQGMRERERIEWFVGLARRCGGPNQGNGGDAGRCGRSSARRSQSRRVVIDVAAVTSRYVTGLPPHGNCRSSGG
jgi:hypothetical protein